MLKLKFADYRFDEGGRSLVPRDETRVLNFGNLLAMLLSSDRGGGSALENRDECLFLDAKVDLSRIGQQIAIQSFEGAGNDLLGRLIQNVTQVFVGSDTNYHFNLDKALGRGDLGELHTSNDNLVWFTKTNYPMRSKCEPFKAQKMVCVVRNPMDTIFEASEIKNLFGRNDSLQIKDNLRADHTHWWNQWVDSQSQNMQTNHDFIMISMLEAIPIYFVRYEDLVANPGPVLTEVFKFVLEVASIEGSVLERRIKELPVPSQPASFCQQAS